MQKVVGIDYGAKHIGLSRGDTMVRLATPLDPIINNGDPWAELIAVVHDENASIVVVGLPRDNRGLETAQSQRCRVFANELKQRLSEAGLRVKIIMQDESLTSVNAETAMQHERRFDPAKLRDGTADSRAAAIILGDYLEDYRG